MTPTRLLTSLTFVAAFAMAAPAHAGQRHGGGSGRSAGRAHAVVAPRGGGVVSRGGARSYPVYRGGVGVRGNVYAPRIVGSRGYGRPVFYRPYYAFRPRLSLGFGLWAGYPVAYPSYYYPYGYAAYPVDPYAYGSSAPAYDYSAPPYPSENPSSAYPPSSDPSGGYGSSGQGYPAPQSAPSVGVQRGGQPTTPGGVSFEITPDTAAVFVDGTYVGAAATFGPTSQPLGLTTGRHRIEIRASGYRTMTFDADVTPGQVLPYQGTLQRD